MKSNVTARVISVGLVLVVFGALLAGWVYLYRHSRAADSRWQNEMLVMLRDVKQLDSDWTANVLRSHTDINPNYDALVQPLQPLLSHMARLNENIGALKQPAFDDAMKSLRQSLDSKITLIDTFKAQNSLLKNSLRYVPTAYKDIQSRVRSERDASLAAESNMRDKTHKALAELERSIRNQSQAGSEDDARLRMAQAMSNVRTRLSSTTMRSGSLNNILNLDNNISLIVDEAMRYATLADQESAQKLRSEITALNAAAANYSAHVREPVLNLTAHLGTLLRLRTVQGDLLREISHIPVGDKADRLAGLLTKRFDSELATQFAYQRYLLVYSAFSTLLVVAITGFVFYRNATERQRLTRLVDKQTMALKENEVHLIHAQKMGAIGEMVAGLAHEVNTPLAAVRSSMESSRELLTDIRDYVDESTKYVDASSPALQGAPVPASAKALHSRVSELRRNIEEINSLQTVDELMEDCIRSTTHIHSVINNMLNFSRLDRTKVSASKVEEGVESTLAIASHMLKSVKVRKVFGETKPVNCDLAQINQVVLNLVKNAAQAMPNGSGEIVIRTSMRSDKEVQIDVSDNGSGIPPNVLPKIWTPFFTTKPKGVGTGLGLSTCKKIVSAHGGDIHVQSTVGKGTTFSIVLPVTPPTSLYEDHGQKKTKGLVAANLPLRPLGI